MKRGVVMSIHKKHAVVMTADGQFLQAPIDVSTQIGEEITFESVYMKPRTLRPVYWYGSAAALVLILFVPLFFFMQRDSQSVVAYVSMDINPSVELGVDENEKVRELRALNDDGEVIIKGLSYEGIHVEEVAASILERAKGSHFLDTPNKEIFITSVMLNDNFAKKRDYEHILTGKVDEKLKQLLTQFEAEATSATITTLSLPNEVREQAAENGVSSGKMAIYLMAKDEGYKLELEQLKQQSIDKATASIGGLKTIVDNAKDTSKEKMKELVAREKEEKAKQHKNDKKPNYLKPSPTPNVSKPTKVEKPTKPEINGINNEKQTEKPDKNGSWGSKPIITPGKPYEPEKPKRPNAGKHDNDNNNDNDDDNSNDNENEDNDKDKDKDKDKEHNHNRDNNDDDNDRNDNRKQDRDDDKRYYDRYNDRNKNDNDNRSERYNNWNDRNDEKKNKDWRQNKDKGHVSNHKD